MEGSQSARGSISLSREVEPWRCESDLWSRVYQRLVPARVARACPEEVTVETVLNDCQAEESLAPAV
jgi:hypothetical protein